jgi:cytoskeletal protein RodZ
MYTLGVWLHQAREARGSTVEEVSAATRIRARLLDALEAGDFAAFPGGDVQVRGFLRLYARYLGLSPDEALARYDAEIEGVEPVLPRAPAERRPSLPARAPTRPLELHPPVASPPPPPSTMGLDRLMIAGVVLIVLLAAVTAVGFMLSRNAGQGAAATVATPETTTAPAPAVAGVPPTTPATLASPIVTPTFPANPQAVVELILEATEHVWVRVTADGQQVFEGMMAAGQTAPWSGRQQVAVDTGNGAGLRVTVNGQSQGTMCGRAQVCTRAWGPAGEVAAP